MKKLILFSILVFSPQLFASKKFLLFVPGFYGSTLVDEKTNDTVWVTASESIFGNRSLTLTLPTSKDPSILNLKAGEVLKRVSLLGPLWGYEAYRKTLNGLEDICQKIGCEVIPLAYDWRREPLLAAKIIDEKISSLSSQNAGAEFFLVAHSYGALATSYYLRYGTQNYETASETWAGLKRVKKVALLAAPFSGAMAIFRNMFYGLETGMNDSLLSPTAYCSFEASYFLLPIKGTDLAYNTKMNSESLGLFDSAHWKQYQWGLFNSSSKTDLSDSEKLNYTSTWLGKAEKFFKLTHAPLKSKLNISNMLYLKGGGDKAVAQGVWLKDKDQAEKIIFYNRDFKKFYPDGSEELTLAHGDGTLTAATMTLPQALQDAGVKAISSHLGHTEVLEHPTSQNLILNFFKE